MPDKKTQDNNAINIIKLTGRMVAEIKSSRLSVAAGSFIDQKLLEKEVRIWLKNR